MKEKPHWTGLCSSALSEVNLTRHDARHLCTRLPTYTRAPFLRGFMISLHQSNECIQSTRRVTAITGGLGGIGILVGKSRLHSGNSLNTLLSRSGRTCKGADFASMCSPSVYGLVKVACCDATTKEYISCVHNLRRFLQFLSGVQSFETDILHASGRSYTMQLLIIKHRSRCQSPRSKNGMPMLCRAWTSLVPA